MKNRKNIQLHGIVLNPQPRFDIESGKIIYDRRDCSERESENDRAENI